MHPVYAHLKRYYTEHLTLFACFYFCKNGLFHGHCKKQCQMSKYWLKAYSRAARYLSNICETRWRAICPQGQAAKPGHPLERLLYIHTRTTTYRHRTLRKQAQLKNACSLAPSFIHTSPRLRLECSHTESLCTGFSHVKGKM